MPVFEMKLRCKSLCGGFGLCGTHELFRRIIKVIIVLICGAGFGYQTYGFMTMYWKYPTVVNLEIIYPEDIDLPAVTICSNNGINASHFCERFPEDCSPKMDYDEFCSSTVFYCDKRKPQERNKTPTILQSKMPKLSWEEYIDLAPRPIPPFQYKVYGSKDVTVDTTNRRWIGVRDAALLPNNCYVFNSLRGNATANPVQIPKTASLSFWMKANKLENFYTTTRTGFQVAIHDPHSLVNPFSDGFSLAAGRWYSINIKQVLKELLKSPYSTNCTDYREMWRSRGGRGPLSGAQCIEECVKNITIQKYNCSRGLAFVKNEIYCASTSGDLPCANQCSPACSSWDYDVNVEEKGPYIGTEAEERTYFAVEFRRMEIDKYSYHPKYEEIELFSVLGGYLGLWLGVSLVAVYNFLESICLLCKRKLRRTQKSPGPQIADVKTFVDAHEKPKNNIYYGTVHLRAWLNENIGSSHYAFPLTPNDDCVRFHSNSVNLKTSEFPGRHSKEIIPKPLPNNSNYFHDWE